MYRNNQGPRGRHEARISHRRMARRKHLVRKILTGSLTAALLLFCLFFLLLRSPLLSGLGDIGIALPGLDYSDGQADAAGENTANHAGAVQDPGSMTAAGLDPGSLDLSGQASGISGELDLGQLYSSSCLLTDLQSNQVIASRNAEKRIYPASLTKIMTAVVALEHTDNLDETVFLPEDIFPVLYAQDASMAGFSPNESATLRDLLYGILLPSGAECSITYAIHTAGSESAFVEWMNQKANELGMDNSHFCNVTGLHDPDHYTTVSDLSLLLKYALSNPDFYEAFTSRSYLTAPTVFHPEGLFLCSTLFSNPEASDVSGGEILGGKTGYTDEAGLCLASLADINGHEYILITADADGSPNTDPYHVLDAVNIYSQLGKQ